MKVIIEILAIFAFVVYAIYSATENSEKREQIQAELVGYNNSISRYLTKKRVSETPLPIAGKVVFIDSKLNKVVPYEEYQINLKYRPTSPDEVKTAIIQDCQYIKIGTYTNGAGAMQEECSVHIVDVETQTWSYWGKVKGSSPSDEIRTRRGSASDEKGGRAMYVFLRENHI